MRRGGGGGRAEPAGEPRGPRGAQGRSLRGGATRGPRPRPRSTACSPAGYAGRGTGSSAPPRQGGGGRASSSSAAAACRRGADSAAPWPQRAHTPPQGPRIREEPPNPQGAPEAGARGPAARAGPRGRSTAAPRRPGRTGNCCSSGRVRTSGSLRRPWQPTRDASSVRCRKGDGGGGLGGAGRGRRAGQQARELSPDQGVRSLPLCVIRPKASPSSAAAGWEGAAGALRVCEDSAVRSRGPGAGGGCGRRGGEGVAGEGERDPRGERCRRPGSRPSQRRRRGSAPAAACPRCARCPPPPARGPPSAARTGCAAEAVHGRQCTALSAHRGRRRPRSRRRSMAAAAGDSATGSDDASAAAARPPPLPPSSSSSSSSPPPTGPRIATTSRASPLAAASAVAAASADRSATSPCARVGAACRPRPCRAHCRPGHLRRPGAAAAPRPALHRPRRCHCCAAGSSHGCADTSAPAACSGPLLQQLPQQRGATGRRSSSGSTPPARTPVPAARPRVCVCAAR